MYRYTILAIVLSFIVIAGLQENAGGQTRKLNPEYNWFMPDEAAKHRRTWMAFGASKEIWGDLLPEVQANLGLIARTISEFEPVTMLVRPADRKLAARLCGERVELIDATLDDI